MCGFLGGTSTNWNYRAGISALEHRGPDSQNQASFSGLELYFARLAIIDTSTAAEQPMRDERGEVCIVYNGELYGHRALKKELEKKGRVFRSQSDSEVLLQAYLEWGEEWTKHVEGMFAVAICDSRLKKLFLLRDRVGIKPLYYYYDGKDLAFASELGSLQLTLEGADLKLDSSAICDYLTYRYIPAPKTLYRNCFKLPPASILEFDLEKRKIASVSRYWNLEVDPSPAPINIDKAAERTRELLHTAVSEQMISDVPLGCFLSGGVDSSAVVSVAAELTNELETFSMGFDVEQHSETGYALLAAKYFGTKHFDEQLGFAQSQDLRKDMHRWFGEPFGDSSAIATYLLAKFARERVTVVLTGDGGDEVFGGYKWYTFFDKLYRYRQFLPKNILNRLFSRVKSSFTRHGACYRWLNGLDAAFSEDLVFYAALLRGVFGSEKRKYREALEIPRDYDDLWFLREHWRKDLPLYTRMQYLDFHTYLPEDILCKVDRSSMAVSLEARVPLLDTKLLEFVFSLPESTRFFQNQLKGLFKHSLRGRVPPEILKRKKKGFGIPLEHYRHLKASEHETILKEVFQISI